MDKYTQDIKTEYLKEFIYWYKNNLHTHTENYVCEQLQCASNMCAMYCITSYLLKTDLSKEQLTQKL